MDEDNNRLYKGCIKLEMSNNNQELIYNQNRQYEDRLFTNYVIEQFFEFSETQFYISQMETSLAVFYD